jgi:outer membrane protein OmpU
MKKFLLASVAVFGFASVAAAEVTLSGSGRFGTVYTDDGTDSETDLSYRLRFNIDAMTETDTGIQFGGRIRLQYDNGDTVEDGQGAAEVNAAKLYAESGGFRFEIGNTDTAFDSLATLYNAELGFISSTTGSYSLFLYDSYQSGPFPEEQAERVGIYLAYTAGSFVGRLSYIDYNQTGAAAGDPDTGLIGVEDEIGVSVDYTAGAFKIGAGYVKDSGGVDGHDVYALLGEYAVSDATNVGVQLIGEDGVPAILAAGDDTTLTVYGNTKLASGLGLGAFVTAVDSDVVYDNDYAIGIGASYDIGGATIAGTIQQGYSDDTYADLGINFSF